MLVTVLDLEKIEILNKLTLIASDTLLSEKKNIIISSSSTKLQA